MALSQGILDQFIQQLTHKKEELMARQQRLFAEDPFNDPGRVNDNSAIDADAAEQFGHETIAAMREQIARTLKDVDHALERLHDGSYGVCVACHTSIDEGRLRVDPTAAYCMECQQKKTVVNVG